MSRRVLLLCIAAAAILSTACSASLEEVKNMAEERGFTPIGNDQVEDGPNTGIEVKMPGDCSATFFMQHGPGDGVFSVEVHNANGQEIYSVPDPHYSEVMKVSQVKNVCKDED